MKLIFLILWGIGVLICIVDIIRAKMIFSKNQKHEKYGQRN